MITTMDNLHKWQTYASKGAGEMRSASGEMKCEEPLQGVTMKWQRRWLAEVVIRARLYWAYWSM